MTGRGEGAVHIGVSAGCRRVSPVRGGSLEKSDCGVTLGRYISNAGRTFVYGNADETQ